MPGTKGDQKDEARPRWFESPDFKDLDVKILQKNMDVDMIDDVMYRTKDAFGESKVEKDVATFIKKYFEDTMPGTSWHCIIGKNFGISMTHATNRLIYFTIKERKIVAKPYYVLLFQSHN